MTLAILTAVILPLTVPQWGQDITTMACWGPADTDAGLSTDCSTMADAVSACKTKAAIVPEGAAVQTFYDCLEQTQ
jgi:hypothetical protein